jgi:hypothetical protein
LSASFFIVILLCFNVVLNPRTRPRGEGYKKSLQATFAPQAGQNLAAGFSCSPQAAQTLPWGLGSTFAPHETQNFAPARNGFPQEEQTSPDAAGAGFGSTFAPHEAQNLAPARSGFPQEEQTSPETGCFGGVLAGAAGAGALADGFQVKL